MKPLPLILLLTACTPTHTVSDYDARYVEAKAMARCDDTQDWCRVKIERLINGSY